ncbi:MAG: glycoside hydrolase N-terminal domain-containing protein [Cyclobacteriaceae bacterium]
MKMFFLVCFFFFGAFANLRAQQDLKRWYSQPARNWNESLPLGNGRLGAIVFGALGGNLRLMTGTRLKSNTGIRTAKGVNPNLFFTSVHQLSSVKKTRTEGRHYYQYDISTEAGKVYV